MLEFISLLSQNQHAEFAKLHLEIIVPERSSITNIKRDTCLKKYQWLKNGLLSQLDLVIIMHNLVLWTGWRRF